MPVKVSEVVQEVVRELQIPLAGEVLNIKYRVFAVDSILLDGLRDLQPEEFDLGLIKTVAAAVAEWDLLNDDGKPVPLTHEALKRVPTAILALVWSRIMEDMKANPLSQSSSSGG